MATLVAHVFTVPDSLIFLRGQPEFMRRHGFEMVVVTAPGPGLDAFGARNGVPTHAIPMSRKITPGEDASSLAALVRLFRRLRPDIVHAHTPKGGLLGTTAATLAGVRARIYHMRGLPLVTARGAQRVLLAASERTSCALATDVLCVGSSLREEAVRRGLVPASKARVLAGGSGNGVDAKGAFDPDRVDPAAVRAFRDRLGIGDAPLVGFVGRLVRDKGVLELVDAWQLLRRNVPDAHLVVAGVFEERDAVPSEVRERLRRDDRVHMLGFVEDLAPLYAALDVLAFPSHREGFPNVPLEAASFRLPVVGARALGTVDAIVDGETGTLVPVGDAHALSRALGRYLTDRELARRHGAAARQRVLGEFSRERVWTELAAFYESLVPSRGRPSARVA